MHALSADMLLPLASQTIACMRCTCVHCHQVQVFPLISTWTCFHSYLLHSLLLVESSLLLLMRVKFVTCTEYRFLYCLLGVDLERHIDPEARGSLEEYSYQVYITWQLPVLTAVPALGWRFLHCTLVIALSATRFSLFPFYIFCSKMVFTFWSSVLLMNVSWWCLCSACVE